MIKKNKLNIAIILISTLLVSYFFAQIHLFEQRAVDAGLVLSNIVLYPDDISPMKEYFVKSWTSLHQISKILLDLDWTFQNISKLIIFVTAILYFLGIFLTANSAINSVSASIFIAIALLIFQKNLGDTDYPSLVFSEHSYGMVSLAMVTCIFGLIFSGNLFFAGLLSSILISLHPLIGIWTSGIILFSLILNKYYLKINVDNKKLIKGYIVGIFFTSISLVYYFYLSGNLNSYFDLESYNNYMKYWEGHRNETAIHLEYLLKTLVLFIFGYLSIMVFGKHFSKNFRFGILCLLSSIIFSSIFYFLYKLLLPNVPDFFVRIMPGRFTILHSVIAWPIILSVLFILIKNLKRKYYILDNLEYFFIIFIILTYSVSHYKTFIKLKNQYINNTSQKVSLYDDKFWSDAKKIKFDGYLLTSYSSSTIAMRKILKPIILDVSSLDFVPYFPNTAKNMSLIIEKVYGIPFNNPPLDIRNRPFLTDENIKSNFENYSEEKWIKLSQEFNFHGIIIPSDWNINLTPVLIGKKFTLYII